MIARWSDRRLLLAAGVFFFLVIVATVLIQPPQKSEDESPSSYSAESGGSKAAYLLLQQLGYDVVRWDNPPRELPSPTAAEPGKTYVLLLIEPGRSSNQLAEKQDIARFLQMGGRVLATGTSGADLLPNADAEANPLPVVGWSKCSPAALSPITHGGEIAMANQSFWKISGSRYTELYDCDKKASVVSYPVGKGEVVWWGSPTPLTNAALVESGNLPLLLGSLGAAANTRIFWDEYFHGERRGLWSYTSGTPLKWMGAQVAMVFCAVLFTFSRRRGPLRPLTRPSRLHPLEFVETLGGLYHQANATNVAVHVVYDRFRHLASRRLGIRGEVPAPELARLMSQRLGYGNTTLARELEEAGAAIYDPNFPIKDALRLVQALNDHMKALELIPPDANRRKF